MPPSHIVTIYPSSYTPPAAPKASSGLSTGAIAGIAAGCAVLGLILLGLLIWFLIRRHNRKKPPKPQPPSEIDTLTAGTEVKKRRISELDSTPGSPPPRFSTGAGYFGDQLRDNKDREPFPPIVEIPILNELESPPEVSEMDSPPTEGATPAREGGREYFDRSARGSRKEKDLAPAIHELPGDDGRFQVHGMHFEPVGTTHSRNISGESRSGATTPSVGSPLRSPVSPALSPALSEYATPFEDPRLLGQTPRASGAPTRNSTVSTAVGSEAGGHRRDLSAVSSSPSSPTAEELEGWALGRRRIDERSLSRDRREDGEGTG